MFTWNGWSQITCTAVKKNIEHLLKTKGTLNDSNNNNKIKLEWFFFGPVFLYLLYLPEYVRFKV